MRFSFRDIQKMIKSAVGYHGTDIATAEKLASKADLFKCTRNEGDWLGPGAYFWHDAPERARYWARRKFGSRGAVVSAKLNLNRCLDLLDLIDFEELRAVEGTFENFAREAAYEYKQRPLMIADGAVWTPKERKRAFLNDRDQSLLEFAVPLIEESRGNPVETVRCAFIWGRAVNRTSALFDWAHVQICVREQYIERAIRDVRIVTESESVR